MKTTTVVLRAYHGKKAVKDKYLKRMRSHMKADQLVRGTSWDKDKSRGCAVGCTLDKYDHNAYPVELGIPVEIAHLEDVMFEEMPEAEAMKWPEQFLMAVNPGADLTDVLYQFNIALLSDPEWGALKYVKDEKWKVQREAIEGVLVLYQKRTPRADPAWSAARSAAESAARSAAESAAWSAAESAAWSAAWSAAESAARSAAWSAAESAAESAARSAAWLWMRDLLLKLLKESK